MELLNIDDKKKRLEEIEQAKKDADRNQMKTALEEFRKSSAYPYIIRFFNEHETKFVDEITRIQTQQMKEVFMLPVKEQRTLLAQMSKRDIILTGVLAIIRRVKEKL